MQRFTSILERFTPVGLERLELVRLLDRVDTKFAFNIDKLPSLLEKLVDEYYILEVNNQRYSEYNSLYFDTPDFDLYHDHLTGRLSRFKIRFREYIKSGTKYFEIKHKSNKSRTIKHRILQTEISTRISDLTEAFVREKTEYDPQLLDAKLWVNYNRITLMSKESLERVTIDIGLKFKSSFNDKSFHNLVIAEVKQIRNGKSFFKTLMKAEKIRPVAISKYCLGVVNLFENVKTNNFKAKLNLIKKIHNGAIANFE